MEKELLSDIQNAAVEAEAQAEKSHADVDEAHYVKGYDRGYANALQWAMGKIDGSY